MVQMLEEEEEEEESNKFEVGRVVDRIVVCSCPLPCPTTSVAVWI